MGIMRGTKVCVAVCPRIRRRVMLRICDGSWPCGKGVHCAIAWWLSRCRDAFAIVWGLWGCGVSLVMGDCWWSRRFKGCEWILLKGQWLHVISMANEGNRVSLQTVGRHGVQVGVMHCRDWHTSHPISAPGRERRCGSGEKGA